MAEPLEMDREILDDPAILTNPPESTLSEQDRFNIQNAGSNGAVNLDKPIPKFQYVPGSKPSPWSELEKTPVIANLDTETKLQAFDTHARRVDSWMKSQEGYSPSDRAAASAAIKARRAQIMSSETVGEKASDFGKMFVDSAKGSLAAIPVAAGSQLTEAGSDTFYDLAGATTSKAIDTVVNDFVRREIPSINKEEFDSLIAEGFTAKRDPQKRIGAFVDRREKLDSAVEGFKADLDNGNFPDNPDDFQKWLDEKQVTILKEAQRFNEDVEDYTADSSRKFSTDLDLVSKLAEYTSTRNDAAFNGIVTQMARSSKRKRAEGDWEKAFKNSEGLIGGIRSAEIAQTGSDEGARLYAEAGTNPIEVGSTIISAVLTGGTAKAFSEATKAGRAAKFGTNTAVDMAVEAGTEAFQAKVDDPNAPVGEAAASGALLGLAFQLTGAGLGAGKRALSGKGRETQSAESPASGKTETTETPSGESAAPAPVPRQETREDGPLRSVLEEFDDPDAEAAEATVAPETTLPPESPEIVTESPSPVMENFTVEPLVDEEVNTPEAAVAVDPVVNESLTTEEAPAETREVVNTFDIDEGLRVEVIRNPDGTAAVEKLNTETGATIPLSGAESAFQNPREALEFVRSTFATDTDGNVIAEEESARPGGETDKLMELLMAEKMQPSQADIRTIGRVARREQSGFRGIESDVASRGDYYNAPLLRDYKGEAQGRLRAIYDRNSSNRAPEVAQMAFDQGLIPEPTAEVLFEEIKKRLDGDSGRVSQMRTSDAEVEAIAERFERSQTEPFEAFFKSIKSPYRRGGVVPASQLQVGDVLQIGDDRATVTEKDGEVVMVNSERYGEHAVEIDDTVGYDAIEENGLPIGEREGLADADVVSREDAEALTNFLREKLGGESRARAVPSREHSAVSKNRRELDAARRLARLFKRRVVGVANFPANGAVSRGDDSNIFIATDSTRPELLVTAHELLHQLRQSYPDLYQKLLDALDADLEAYVKELREEHSDKSIDVLKEEFLADYVAERAGDPAFWESLARRDPSAFARFAEFVIDFLRQIADKIRGDKIKVERYLRDVAAMRRTLEDVLVAFKARQEQADRGVLDVSLAESLPFDEQMPFADARDIVSDNRPDVLTGSNFYSASQSTRPGVPVRFYRGRPVQSSGIDVDPERQDYGPGVYYTDDIRSAQYFSFREDADDFSGVSALTIAGNLFKFQGIKSTSPELKSLVESLGQEFVESDWASIIQNTSPYQALARLAGGKVALSDALKGLGYDGLIGELGISGLSGTAGQVVLFDESLAVPSRMPEGFGPSADIRFADRRTKPNQQVYGQKIGREDEMQGEEELTSVIRENYFDGGAPITPESRDEAIWMLEEMRNGTFDASHETGLDAAGAVLTGELWNFANRLLARGDSTLYERMKGEKNDYNGREGTRSARILNAFGWYSRETDQAVSQINEAKRDAVNADAGDGRAADIIEEMQKTIDAQKVEIEQLNKEKAEKFDAFLKAKQGAGATDTTEALTKQLIGNQKAGERTKRAVKRLEDFMVETFGEIRFSDVKLTAENLSPQDRDTLVMRWFREQATSKHKKKAVFVRNLMEAGRTREFAEGLFLKAAEFRAEIADGLKADKADKKAAEPAKSILEQTQDAINAESVKNDRMNRKAEKLSERYLKGPKKRQPSNRKKDAWENTVESLTKQGSAFNREAAVKALIRDGLDQENASKLATAIEAKIKNESLKATKKTSAEQAKDIIARYKTPVEDAQRSKNPLRTLINKAVAKDSEVTESAFMADARAAGIPKAEAADLWTDILELREIRDAVRKVAEAERKAKNDAKADQEMAARLIERLENPQDPATVRTKRTTARAYEEIFKADVPTPSRESFVGTLVNAGVDVKTANDLYTLALKEKDRLAQEKRDRATKRFLSDRAITAIKKEILAHPSLKIVGPQERLQIMVRILQDRADMTLEDAYRAAKMFDEMIVEQWSLAHEQIAEEIATRRNAPYFRKEKGASKGKVKKTSFDKLLEAIRSGALDPRRRVLDEVAKANGWTDLSERELSELARLDALLDDPEITDFEQIRYKRQMLAIYQRSALPPTVWKVISETYVANIFSGPSTMMIGLWALADSLMTVPRDFVVSAIGSANKGGKLADSRNLTGFFTALSRSHQNVAAGLNDAIVTMRTGDMRNVMADELARSIGSLDKVWARTLPILTNPSASKARKAGALATLFYTSGRFALRVLSAMDSFTRGINRRFQTELELFSKAGNLGWSKKRIKALLANVAVEKNHFADLADARGFKGADKAAFINDRLAMAMYAAFQGEAVMMDPDTVPRATREANLPTGMGEIQIGTAMLPGKLASAMKTVSTEGGLLGKIAVPVVQTPYNAFHRSAWYTPYAFVRLLGTAVHTRMGIVPFRNWEKTHYPEALADPVQLTLRATEAVLGNAILGGVAGAIISQLMEEDDEKRWLWINLAGPSAATGATLAERGAWLATGRRPFTLQFKDGNDRVTMAFRRGGLEPFNFPMTLFGVIDQMKYEKGGYETPWEKYTAVLAKETLGEAMFFLRSFTSRGFAMDRGRLGSEVGYRLSGFVPWASMLKTPNRFEDMAQRPEGFIPNVAWQMPLVPQMNEREPALNALGQPVGFNETSPGFMQSRIGLPVGTVPNAERNRSSSNPTYQDVLMLLNDKGVFPSDTRKSDLDATAGRETTPEEFRAFQKARGEALLSFLRANYKEFWAMEPERFSDILSTRSGTITKQVKRSMSLYSRGE
jgi:hypothetical protein